MEPPVLWVTRTSADDPRAADRKPRPLSTPPMRWSIPLAAAGDAAAEDGPRGS